LTGKIPLDRDGESSKTLRVSPAPGSESYRTKPPNSSEKDGVDEVARNSTHLHVSFRGATPHEARGWPGTFLTAFQFLVLIVCCCSFHLPANAQSKPVRRILIINEAGSAYPAIDIINRGIQSALESSPHRLEFYSEYLETILFPDPATQQAFRTAILRKYENRKPDVIITVGPSPLKFMEETHEQSFGGVPIVFCLPAGTIPSSPALDADFTGVETDISAANTLEAALRLRPGTERVVVVGGDGDYDKQMQRTIKQQLEPFEKRVNILYLTNLAMSDLLERLRHLPAHTVILFTTIAQDATGNRFKSSETAPMVIAAANAPVFSLFDIYLGHGEVGGDLASLSQQGRIAGSMTLRLLSGEKAQNILRVQDVADYMFDWRALRRWGMRERDLPAGSTLINRELSTWERTRGIWISSIVVILFLSAIAAYLQYSRKQLRAARDSQLHLSGLLINAQEQERKRLAAELHDDFSQRVAVLVFGLGAAQEGLPVSSNGVKGKLQDLKQAASELGDDLHTVSHRLHSSTLDALGLVHGLRALCREFAARQNVEIDFSSEDVPAHVHPDVALCLFRIVQEALQNLRKHSGATKAQVNLRKVGNLMVLSVQDEGKGFDAKHVNYKAGLGIGSMEGRARLVGGHFDIHSEPGKGTRIEVRVPLQTELTPSET